MNNSLKGALLSGLVFPGLGQVALKHYRRGFALMLTILISLALVVIQAAQQAVSILKRLDLEKGSVDINAIIAAANQASTSSGSFIYDVLLLLITFCWIVGVIDAYRIGKKVDLEKQPVVQI